VFGVLGGMGPLASAEFLRTIYEYSLRGPEQQSPVVLVYSDPTFPDRTDAFLAGEAGVVLEQLTGALGALTRMGAGRVVMCCMTIHHLLPQLPDELRASVVSLLDVCFDSLARAGGRHLLISSTGTRRLRLFERHARWEELSRHVVLPDEGDQYRIHRDLIYPIKNNPDLRELTPLLESLLAKYRVDSFIAGCSEIHLLAKHYEAGGGRRKYGCIDPLSVIARELAQECT
jgi:aspartate racemase